MEQFLWQIAGVGAVGTILAASFCRGQQSVELILKDEQKVALYNECGLELHTDELNYKCHPQAIALPAITRPIERLICCTKAYDVSKLLLSLREHLSSESIIILIHNGMGVIDEIKEQLPELRIISGITTVGGYLEKPFGVKAFLKGNIVLGETIGHYSVEEVQSIKNSFNLSMLNVEWSDSIQDLIWDKFAINCSINLLTALYACKNGELMQHLDLLKQLTAEIALVFRAYGKDIVANDLFETVCRVIKNTAGNYSSMNQDIKNNRQTELHYLNEYLLQLAVQQNIEVPLTKDLLRQFKNRSLY